MSGLRAVIADTSARLSAAGIDQASAQARMLVCLALGVDPGQLALVESVSPTQSARLAGFVDRRVAGEPLQHIMGEAYFRTISVKVGPGVFIPRPETELLAGWAIDRVRPGEDRVVELCAGSGAVSLAIAEEARPMAQWAVEKDSDAFAYLKTNVAGTIVQPVLADMDGALNDLNATIDIVVANPPYVPDDVRGRLPVDVEADPPQALYSGVDGLRDTVTVVGVARRLLVPGGLLGSEHGEDQGEAVAAIFRQAGFTDVQVHTDLTRRARFTTGRKAG